MGRAEDVLTLTMRATAPGVLAAFARRTNYTPRVTHENWLVCAAAGPQRGSGVDSLESNLPTPHQERVWCGAVRRRFDFGRKCENAGVAGGAADATNTEYLSFITQFFTLTII